MPNSPNMGLPEPVVGVTAGPAWATLLVSCLDIIDSHSHTTGSGVPITPGAININSDLTFGSNNASALKSSIYTPQGAPIAATGIYLGCTYVSGVDLYFNDVDGNQVRITQSGGVAGTPGSIAGLTSPASASYVAVGGKFVWQSDANVAADMDFAAAILRNTSVSSFALTLQPPTLGSDYSITLPTLPVSQKIMTMDASGVMAAPYAVDGGTVAISANVIGVPAGGINTTQLAAGSVTGVKLNSNVVDNTTIVISATQLSIPSSVNLPGNSVKENGLNVAVSSTNASTSLKIIRGYVEFDGSTIAGEGFTCTRTGTGAYTLSWTSPFASTPSVVVCPAQNVAAGAVSYSADVNNGFIVTFTIGGGGTVNTNYRFQFIAMGPR